MTHVHANGDHHGDHEDQSDDGAVAPLVAAMSRSPRLWLRGAAGDRAAIARLLSLLGLEVMTLGFGDPLPSSREIAFAVDALAARMPTALQRLSGGWPAAKEARHLGVFRAALRAAARHLVPTGRVMEHDLTAALLVDEGRALFGSSSVDVTSFERLVTQPIDGLDARVIDRTKRITEGMTSAALDAASPQHLRAVRHLGASLSDEHQRWVLHAVAREPAGTARHLALIELGLRAPSPDTRSAVLASATRGLAALVAADTSAPALEHACFVTVARGFASP